MFIFQACDLEKTYMTFMLKFKTKPRKTILNSVWGQKCHSLKYVELKYSLLLY